MEGLGFGINFTWSGFHAQRNANEGPVRIQCKCQVPIYVFPEKKLFSLVIFQNRIIMFCLPVPTLIYLQEIYIFPGRSVYFAAAKYVDRSREYIYRRHMDIGIGTEAVQFLFREYIL
jgi:hypothetical protein